MGSFQIRLEFGSISDHQRFAPHQETLYFQFGAEFGKGFSHLKCMGSFQIRYEFGSFSAHQIYAPYQETLYFQFDAEFGKIFPIKNEWSNFKFGKSSVLFRLTENDPNSYRI